MATSPTSVRAAILAATLALAGPAWTQAQLPAEISLRRADAQPLTAVALGDRLPLEVVVDAGAAPVSGVAVYLSFDSTVFQLAPPPGTPAHGEVAVPFAPGDWLDGVVLVNRAEDGAEGRTYLAYAEALGVQRRPSRGRGVVARFSLEAIRRPLGDVTAIRVEERGHDRVSAYTRADAPGVEQAFGQPLGSASVRVTGFQVRPLPDLEVVEGDGPQVAYVDLDAFVDQEGAQVIWSASFVDGLNTAIDVDGRATMTPQGIVGDTVVTFTAFEVGEGNEDAAVARVHVRSRPRIDGLPDSVTFLEDGASSPLVLDAFVTDLDDADERLTWSATNGSFVHVEVDPATRTLVLSADPDAFGQTPVRLVVADASGLADTAVTQVVVTAVNDPPAILRLPPVYPTLGEGGAVVVPLADLILDVDDLADSLQILHPTEGGISAGLTADGQGLQIAGTAAGRGVVRLTVQDRGGKVAEGRLVAVVLPAGQTLAPEIRPLPELRFPAGIPGTLDLNPYVADDGPAGSLVWTAAAPPQLRPVVRDGVLLVTAQAGFTGPGAIALTATDADGNQDSRSLAVEVLPAGQPQPPRLFPPAKIGLVGGADAMERLLDLDAIVDDPDDADADIRWTVTASAGLTAEVDSVRRVHLTALDGLDEVASLTLTATDAGGLADTRSIPVLVVAAGGAPLIGTLAPVALDSLAAVGRVDLDDHVFDDEDFESELEWSAQGEAGIAVDLDPATHLLRVRRDAAAGGLPASEARVLLTVRDTDGQERSAILTVTLPPVFQLAPIPDLTLYAGDTDSSLVLRDYVVQQPPPALRWSVAPAAQLTATIDSATTRVRVAAADADFVGSEILQFAAADAGGRTRLAPVRVRVRGRGLTPQLRSLPPLTLRGGEEDRSLDLDDYVVDDDPDSTLRWAVGALADVAAAVDSLNHELSLRPLESAIGPRTLPLLVTDPAGNSALGFLEVQILRGGQAPVIAPLPQLLLPSGGPEEAVSLDLFVADPDTPDDGIAWSAAAEPGVAARVDGRRLYVSVPVGQQGLRRVTLVATDPQGNRAEAQLLVRIPQDDRPPGFALKARRDPGATSRLDLEIRPTEALDGPPTVRLNGVAAEVVDAGDSAWVASFAIPPVAGDQALTVEVEGTDRAGNRGARRAQIALRRVIEEGGTLASADGRATVNVPGAVARPGRVAVLYPLAEADLPAGAPVGEGPVWALDVAAGRTLDAPVTLNLFGGGAAADDGLGIERWNPDAGSWQDVPTAADEESGWLSAALREPGLYRLGPVEPASRRPVTSLGNYPNPFNAGVGAATRVEYEVGTAGAVHLGVYNILGQPVRVLVDEGYQEVGVWTVDWDGRDDGGRPVASGVYLYELREPGATRLRRMLLVR